MDRDGRVVTPLDPTQRARGAAALVDDGVEAVAVCFLHAYPTPRTSRRSRELARPRISRRSFVSLSSEVVAELREYPRCVTTCANAYVQPLMDRYLASLERELCDARLPRRPAADAFGGRPRLAGRQRAPSRSGCSSPARPAAASRPRCSASSRARTDVISFDMGGTTAKACLIEDGRDRDRPDDGGGARAPLQARLRPADQGARHRHDRDRRRRRLDRRRSTRSDCCKVGPHSAGADPGPACYGRGGTEPTVTDANLVLGFYDPGFFLGGRMALDRKAASRRPGDGRRASSASRRSRPPGASTRSSTESMAAAARIHLVEKGKDPRTLRDGRVRRRRAGACRRRRAHPRRARGDHSAGLGRGLVRSASSSRRSASSACAPPGRIWRRLRCRGDQRGPGRPGDRRAVRCSPRPALRRRDVTVERTADMRLVGQMHEINVPLPAGTIGAASLGAIRAAFADVYTRALHLALWRGRHRGDQLPRARAGPDARAVV